MINNITRVSLTESKCSGCGACMNVCLKKAIALKERNGYFLFPEVDADVCNNCGLCKSVCPALKPLELRETKKYPVAYGCYLADDEARKKSTSGGAFTALAKAVLIKGGYVCAAALTEGVSLNHIIISDISELDKFHGSKYIQSNTGFIYNDVKKLLDDGKSVLFVGTPCQVAALKAVLGKKYDNLLTADLFCYGVPPQKLFKQYVDEITGGKSDTVKNVKFRDKSAEGWEKFHLSFDYEGGRYDTLGTDDTYFKAFRDCLTLRRSCTNCKFAELPRQGDFTIGDFLYLAKQELNITDDKGVSTLIVNNEKAEEFLNGIKEDFAVLKQVDLHKITMTNLLEYHSYPHANAERFRDALYRGEYASVKELMDEYLVKNDGIAILNWHDSHNNYGSVLTGYALKERIKQKIGYSPIHIICYAKGGHPDISDLIDFDHEYIPSTAPCWTDWEHRQLNKYFQTFIAGPDGVWRNMGFSPNFYRYLLDFADISKNICSYAPSFGLNRIVNSSIGDPTEREPSQFDLTKRKQLLKRFNHISVREDSGVTLCRDYFDVKAEHVLDAVFLLKEKDYQKLIDTSELEIPKNYFCRYIINPSCVDPEIFSYKEENCPVIPLYEGKDHITFVKKTDLDDWQYHGPKLVDWLKLIQGCKYLITDSYHGLCFAIIFKKPFVLTNVTFAGQERHKSLLKMLGITDNRFASTLDDCKRILSTPINWGAVYKNLEFWYQKSDAFLDKILADNKPDKIRNLLHSFEIQQELVSTLSPVYPVAPNPPSLDWKLKILGISILKKKTNGNTKKIKLFGVPVYRTKQKEEGRKRIYFLFLPFDLKKEGTKTFLSFCGIKICSLKR